MGIYDKIHDDNEDFWDYAFGSYVLYVYKNGHSTSAWKEISGTLKDDCITFLTNYIAGLGTLKTELEGL